MNDLDKILKIIDQAPSKFESKIPDIEKKIFKDVSLLLKDLKVSSTGKIKTSIENLQLINEIKAKLGKIVVSKEYSKIVNKFVESIPAISNFQTSTHGITGEPKKLMTAVAKAQIDKTLEGLIGAGYKQTVVSNLYNTLLTNVTSGGSYSDLTEQLRNQLITTEESPGLLSKYAQTYVVDTLGRFAGQGNAMIADTLGSEWFQYIGSNITTTREFCEHLTKKRYVHISEIPTLLEGNIDGHECELNPKTGLPKGMKDDTTPENFIVNRGGWNCGHELIPVDELTVPKAVRDKIEAANANQYQFNSNNLEDRGFHIVDNDVSKNYNEIMKGFNLEKLDDDLTSIFESYNSKIVQKTIETVNDDKIKISYKTNNKIYLERTFTGNGVVKHDYFDIPNELQGKGISKSVFRSLYEQYKNAGINRIDVYANITVGGYTWARYGFVANAKSYNSLLKNAEIRSESPNITNVTKKDYDDFVNWIKQYEGKDIPLWEITQKSYGKDILKKSEWGGYLDLVDDNSRKIFENYLGLK